MRKLQMPWPIFWRIFWRVALFAIVGAVIVGLALVIQLAEYLPPSPSFLSQSVHPNRGDLNIFAPLYGAFCLAVPGFLTARNRDYADALFLAAGGALVGALAGAFCGKLSAGMLHSLTGFDNLPLLVGGSTAVGALLGTLYSSLNPRFTASKTSLHEDESQTKDNIEYSKGNELR